MPPESLDIVLPEGWAQPPGFSAMTLVEVRALYGESAQVEVEATASLPAGGAP